MLGCQYKVRYALFAFLVFLTMAPWSAADEQLPRREDALAALQKATSYYRTHVATHGGYVYHYSLDLKQRWGEGPATTDQIWVQHPGTPSVGIAFLRAYEATGDKACLTAAQDAATALIYGQLVSGGWTNCVDFNPRGEKVAQYRNGKARGENHSTFDDGITQSALQFLMQIDQTLEFKNEPIHEAVKVGLAALLAAQYPNGAFPQAWTKPVPETKVLPARFPDYEWRTEGKIKNYWDMYTLNDDVAVFLADTLIDAYRIYKDDRYKSSLARLGDFLLLAQLPEPQPAWAQQYGYEMYPIWARRFEPPAVSGRESEGALLTLLKIHAVTKDKKYLAPFPSALAYLRKSLLPNGQLARYYELKTNRPLYMSRSGKDYSLTYDDSKLPAHYGWKNESHLATLESLYQAALRGELTRTLPTRLQAEPAAPLAKIVGSLDDQGRWVSVYDGERLVGQPKFDKGERYFSSEVFCRNVEALSSFLRNSR